MNKILSIVIVSLLATTAMAQTKLAYVDVQKAIQASSEGKKAKAELEVEFNKKKKELEKKDGDLKKMGEDLDRKKAVLSEDAFAKKRAEFDEEMLKFRDAMNKSQLDIQKKERELTAPILDKMRKVIEKVAADQKIDMVFEKSQGIVWASASLEITEAVIKEFEKTK